ncbi:MAG: hypothetical protein H7144_16685 [Burkholderiales bacterium]|nr:hypothetical protein [Phycisphaerae bacterium]
MTIETLKELLSAEPFQPLRIIMASGKEYDVTNPGLVHMQKSQAFLFYPKSDRFALIRFSQITSVESQQAA